MELLKNRELVAAICMTIASYLSVLLASSDSIYKYTTLIILLCTVFQWLRVAKNYINTTIEKKLEELKNKDSD